MTPSIRSYIYGAILTLFSVSFGYSTHLSGGDIQYRYIGDSTGINHHYEILLRVYRDVTGAGLGTTANVTVTSSCFNNLSVTCNLIPGSGGIAPTLHDCVDPTSPSTKTLEIYAYKGYVTLTGACSDWKFYWSSCCRPPGITNIPASSSQGFYFEAELNNFLGNNSSPLFVSEPVRAFCVNNNFNWKQSVVEKDGDSLYFSLINVRELAGGPVDIPFSAGYSAAQPVTTNPAGGLTLNVQTGNINFTPSQQEIDVLAVLVDEYRFDSTYLQWVHIGSSNRDMMITVSPTCSQQAQAGVILDYNAQGTYIDPSTGRPTIDYDCLDSSVVMNFANKLDCSTISADGTDFRLTAPNGQPIPVKEIVSVCDVNNETSQLLLKLHKPLAFNGYYYLYSKIGNDGNTLLNKCGFPMDEFDTIQLKVQGCFQMQMEIKNVTIVDDFNPKVEWYADTSTYPTYLFDKFKIFRKDPGGAYQHVGDVFDQYKNYYVDTDKDGGDVDQFSYKYKVEMVLNNIEMGKTRDINSILLKGGGNTCDTVNLIWKSYNGWQNPDYTVMLGTDDGAGGYTWTVHNHALSGANPTTDTVYKFVTNLDQGSYKIRVETDEPGGGNYTSISNWIDCNVVNPIPPDPPELVIPNIITPNSDGINDGFTIQGITAYSGKRYVSIHNRWGKIVYENSNYDNSNPWNGTDMNGNKLADGVYFYTVDLFDQPSGKSLYKNGTVTVMGN